MRAAEGGALAGVTVELKLQDRIAKAVTSRDGIFEFRELLPGAIPWR